LIAAKFEEVEEPLVEDFVYIADNSFSHQDLITRESRVLGIVEWSLCHTTTYEWLEYLLYTQKILEQNIIDATRALIDTTLLLYDVLVYPPWEIASCCINIVLQQKEAEAEENNLYRLICYGFKEHSDKDGIKSTIPADTMIFLSDIVTLKKKKLGE
jgi:hypothetical protein